MVPSHPAQDLVAFQGILDPCRHGAGASWTWALTSGGAPQEELAVMPQAELDTLRKASLSNFMTTLTEAAPPPRHTLDVR